MNNNKYSKAYKEVLEIIKFFPKDEFDKIPREKIEFYRNNSDRDYSFEINPEIDLSDQNISNEAYAIIIGLFEDYYATGEQKIKIREILALNQQKLEVEKRKKYNPDDLFKSNSTDTELIESQKNTEEVTALVEYKENFFIKFKNFILKLLHIK
ncbi:MAG: hypothetical protein IJH12_02825 [Clostridia bacterium]|nr:hypothetical protein [Clostridia bacterium]